MPTFYDASTAPATATFSSPTITLTSGDTTRAVGRVALTTSNSATETSHKITVTQRPVIVRFGTSPGAQDIWPSSVLHPGVHILTFAPGATNYYAQVTLMPYGAATCKIENAGSGDLKLTLPYSIGEIGDLRFEQSNDVVYIYHPDHETRVLERRANDSWGLRLFGAYNGPWGDENTTTVTLTAGASAGGAVTITASEAVFVAADVGRLVRMLTPGGTNDTSYTSVTTGSAVRVSGVGANRALRVNVTYASGAVLTTELQRSEDKGVTWKRVYLFDGTAQVAYNDGLDGEDVLYRTACTAFTSGSARLLLIFTGRNEGVARVTAYTSQTQVTADVLTPIADASSSLATSRWALGAWSDTAGWPAAGAIYDGRHFVVRAASLWGSVAGDFYDFALGENDADAISRALSTGEHNTSVWIEGAARLAIGTVGGEIEVRASTQDEPLTPTNNGARQEANAGSSNVQAVRHGGRIIHVNRSGTRLQELSVGDGGRLVSADLSRLHRLIAGEPGSAGFVQLAVQREPEPRIWGVRTDGQLVSALYAPDERVLGFARRTTATLAGESDFESVCWIPGADGEDVGYVVVKRTIGGATKRFIEKFAPELWVDSEDAWRLDCAVAYSGSSATAISGLSHLNGETVYAWANGNMQGPFTVASGAITLTTAATYAIIGLLYTGKYKSHRINAGAAKGTALAMEKRIDRMALMLDKTAGGAVAIGPTFDDIDLRLPSHQNGDLMDSPVSLWSSDWIVPFDGLWEQDARFVLVMDTAGPATVLACVIGVETNER